MQGITIHIGKQTRTLRFTNAALLTAQKLLDNKMTVREALSLHRDVGVVVTCAAAAFLHEDKKVSPARICKWLDDEPRKYLELEAKVVMAAEQQYRAMGVIDDDEAASGEVVEPPEAGETTAGSTSSDSPAASTSVSTLPSD